MIAGMQRVEIGDAVDAMTTAPLVGAWVHTPA
jgi:hypothetical protein